MVMRYVISAWSHLRGVEGGVRALTCGCVAKRIRRGSTKVRAGWKGGGTMRAVASLILQTFIEKKTPPLSYVEGSSFVPFDSAVEEC